MYSTIEPLGMLMINQLVMAMGIPNQKDKYNGKTI